MNERQYTHTFAFACINGRFSAPHILMESIFLVFLGCLLPNVLWYGILMYVCGHVLRKRKRITMVKYLAAKSWWMVIMLSTAFYAKFNYLRKKKKKKNVIIIWEFQQTSSTSNPFQFSLITDHILPWQRSAHINAVSLALSCVYIT